MRALVTGGSGFVGRWLTRRLVERGAEVFVTGMGDRLVPGGILSDHLLSQVRWMPADARDDERMNRVVDESAPDVVFHLAGVSFPPDADKSPVATYDVNMLGAVRLLSAIRRARAEGRIDPAVVVIGSGMQYGLHDAADMPLTETAEQRPATVYAASKAAQEVAALQAGIASGIRVICTRSFNHSGHGQSEDYLLPALVGRVRRLREAPGPLVLGANAVRDFLHVDDVVDAYLLLASGGRAGQVYNVASGTGVSVRDLAQRVLLRAGVAADISTEPSLVRPSDIPVLVGSPAKLQRDTGWTPRKTHDHIIADLLYASTD